MTSTKVVTSPVNLETESTTVVEKEKPKPPEKKSLFSRITTGKVVKPRRVMLYGVQGVGKSTWASMAPSPIFIPTEEGLNDIDCAKFPLISSMEEMRNALMDIYQENHEYKTVVVDSLDRLEKIIWNTVCLENNPPLKNFGEFDYGKGYVAAITKWSEILKALDAIRANRNMIIILLAHTHIERFEAPETESYDRYGPKIHRSAAAFIQEWCDEVLFATYQVYTQTQDEGFGRKRTQGVGKGERIVRTSERPSCMAKNRLNLPFELKLDWREYAKYLPGAKS